MKSKSSARKIFAENLRKARLAKGLSQEIFAELAGLHRTYVGSVERAERNVSIDNMERLAAAAGVSLTSLLQEGKR
ncbi:MAG TPA: helix-turn-helix transcriptional regulator [Verrucomicrobiae bacterium]|jgi:transcriptional regulator with XRE-family HTH domain|nr:helix-turn-helix transcriptional regulator [Verrucomicrobiae bacterium]